MKPSELLISKDRWCVGAQALDKNGCEVGATSPDAVRWCMLGAVVKCFGHDREEEFYDRLWKATHGVGAFNDTHTFEEVRAKLIEVGL